MQMLLFFFYALGLDSYWHALKLLARLKDESKVENNEKVRSSGHAP